MAVMGVVLVGLAVAFYFSPIRPWLADTEAVRRKLAAMGWWAYPACVLGVAVLVAWRWRLTFATIPSGLLALHLFDWLT